MLSRTASGLRFALVPPGRVPQELSMICQGITSDAVPCTRHAIKSDCYCTWHDLSRKPITPKIAGWISSAQVNIPDQQVDTLASAQYRFNYAMIRLNEEQGFNRSMVFSVRFLTVTTLLLLTPELTHTARGQMITDKLINRMSQYPHLAAYREYFARKLSVRHRQKAKKRYIESIIKESDLGQDIAGVVSSFV